MQEMTALLASFGLAIPTPDTPVQLSDWHDKASHTTALSAANEAPFQPGVRARQDSARLATEYENWAVLDLPRALFTLPPGVESRFHRFLRAYHIRAVTKKESIEDATQSPVAAIADEPDEHVASLDAEAEKKVADVRARAPRWMLTSTVTYYY